MTKVAVAEEGRRGLEAVAALRDRVGGSLPAGEWRRIDQFEEDLFATLIGDFDAMHNETGWGEDVGLGGSVVLGVHVLSLVPAMLEEHDLPVRENAAITWRPIRLGKVRIPTSLPVGARFRAHTEVLDVATPSPSTVSITTSHKIEIENEDKPFLVVSEFVSLFELVD